MCPAVISNMTVQTWEASDWVWGRLGMTSTLESLVIFFLFFHSFFHSSLSPQSNRSRQMAAVAELCSAWGLLCLRFLPVKTGFFPPHWHKVLVIGNNRVSLFLCNILPYNVKSHDFIWLPDLAITHHFYLILCSTKCVSLKIFNLNISFIKCFRWFFWAREENFHRTTTHRDL